VKSRREFQTLRLATEKATAVGVDPEAQYCEKLTVGRMQMPPSVSTGDWNAVVQQVWWFASVQTMNCHCQLEEPGRDVKPVKFVVVQYLT